VEASQKELKFEFPANRSYDNAVVGSIPEGIEILKDFKFSAYFLILEASQKELKD